MRGNRIGSSGDGKSGGDEMERSERVQDDLRLSYRYLGF